MTRVILQNLCFLTEESALFDRNYIEAVDALNDLTMTMDSITMLRYLEAVNISNLSKFPPVGSVCPKEECAYIEAQGRYEDVYFQKRKLEEGKTVYIFKRNYDKKDGVTYSNGKYLKPSTFIDLQDVLNKELT